MGGIRTDLGGRTSLARPLRCRRSRLHRRARRQSPGLQFPARRARLRRARRAIHAGRRPAARARFDCWRTPDPPQSASPQEEAMRVEDLIAALQASMWAHAGLLREESSLRQGLAAQAACEAALAEIAARRPRQPPPGRSAVHEPRRPRHSGLRSGPHREPRRALPQRLPKARRRELQEAFGPWPRWKVRFEEW